MKHSPIALICLWTCLFTGMAAAFTQTVNFSSIGGGHRKANLQPLGADCMVEIGAFTVGFNPANQPRDTWQANWHPLKRVQYDAQSLEFDGVANYDSNAAPYTTSNRIWVWIYDRSGNWCVYGNTAWFWPNTSFPSGPPLECAPEYANVSLAGSTGTSSPWITCELVTDASSPRVTFPQWAELTLPVGFRTKGGDYDNDGQNNLMEYALGSDPKNAGSFSTTVIVKDYSGSRYLAALVNKGWTTGVTYTVQWSGTLSGWNTSGLTTVVNNAVSLEMRDAAIVGTDPRRFLRVHILCPD
jgi:hypothetical protein